MARGVKQGSDADVLSWNPPPDGPWERRRPLRKGITVTVVVLALIGGGTLAANAIRVDRPTTGPLEPAPLADARTQPSEAWRFSFTDFAIDIAPHNPQAITIGSVVRVGADTVAVAPALPAGDVSGEFRPRVIAFDTRTGDVVWQSKPLIFDEVATRVTCTEGTSRALPCIVFGYEAHERSAKLVVLNPRNGAVIRERVVADDAPSGSWSKLAVRGDDVVLVEHTEQAIIVSRENALSGKRRWSRTLPGPAVSLPAFGSEHLTLTLDDRYATLDLATGVEALALGDDRGDTVDMRMIIPWGNRSVLRLHLNASTANRLLDVVGESGPVTTGVGFGGTLTGGPNDPLVVLTPDGAEFVELDLASGRELWRLPANEPLFQAISGESLLLVVGHSTISLVDRDAGLRRWAAATEPLLMAPTPDKISTAVLGGTTAYAWRGDQVVAYDLIDGTELWRLPVPNGGGQGLHNLAGQLAFVGSSTITGYR